MLLAFIFANYIIYSIFCSKIIKLYLKGRNAGEGESERLVLGASFLDLTMLS